jgi:predicted secreted protein
MGSFVDGIARSLLATIAAVIGISALAVVVGIGLKLTVPGAIGLYFVTWWIVLFAILPVRIHTQSDAGVVTLGTEPGAPASPALRERAIWTSLAAGGGIHPYGSGSAADRAVGLKALVLAFCRRMGSYPIRSAASGRRFPDRIQAKTDACASPDISCRCCGTRHVKRRSHLTV